MSKMKLVAIIYCAFLILQPARAISAQYFTDVPKTAWFAEYVYTLAEEGIIDHSHISFRPHEVINRAEAFKLIVESAGLEIHPENIDLNYHSDITTKDWFYPYAQAVIEYELETDYNPSFRPAQSISRADFVRAMEIAFSMSGKYDRRNFEKLQDCPLQDISHHYAEGFIADLCELNIVLGRSKYIFEPDSELNRAEAVTFVYRMKRLVDTTNSVE